MKRTIDDFLDVEYRDYAEVVSFKRALPCIIDGFKPVRRKIFYYMKKSNGEFIRVSSIAGGLAEKCNYHHGEASAQQTIINMSKDFPSSNNIPILLPKGSFGSKLLPKSAAQARYIHSKYNPLMDYIYLDNELTPAATDLEDPEPEFYLPIIPMFLVNGISGIGIGYAVKILPRSIRDVIRLTETTLESIQIDEPIVYYQNCNYNVQRVTNSSFRITGNYKIKDNTVEISEFLPGDDRSKICENLLSLKDSGIITDFKDESKEEFKIIVKLGKSLTEQQIVDKLNISKVFHENYTLLDEHGSIKVFNSITEIVKYFVDYRLKIYTQRKELKTKQWRYEIEKRHAIIMFIQDIDQVTKMNEPEIKKLFKGRISEELIKYCLNKPLQSFLKMNVKKLESEIKELEKQIVSYNKISEKELYLKDLKILKEKI